MYMYTYTISYRAVNVVGSHWVVFSIFCSMLHFFSLSHYFVHGLSCFSSSLHPKHPSFIISYLCRGTFFRVAPSFKVLLEIYLYLFTFICILYTFLPSFFFRLSFCFSFCFQGRHLIFPPLPSLYLLLSFSFPYN